jgi:indolepyruvate ferredoxin oxidoreductase beta subunit
VIPFPAQAPSQPTTKAGRRLYQRVMTELPVAARNFTIEGVRRLMDYQDALYADLYLDRLKQIGALDPDGALTQETARYLALWMSYEDTIRVADLKTRKTRFMRVIEEVRAEPAQVTVITEFMHPRLQEVCETMPAWLGKRILSSKMLSRASTPLFSHGRHVTTSGLTWFLILRMLAGLRSWRRGTLRYREEQERIEAWLALVRGAARADKPIALELVQCQRLVKGYGDTFARGLRSFGLIMATYQGLCGRPDTAAVLHALRDAALKDENGIALGDELACLRNWI